MSFADRPVESVMQHEYVSVKPADQLDFVDDVMKLGRIRHMPVVDGDRLVGVVSQRDLLSASLSKTLSFDHDERRTFLRSVGVSEAMTSDPVTIGLRETLREAAQRMLERRIGCLPVVDDEGRLVGLVTETDLLAAAYGR